MNKTSDLRVGIFSLKNDLHALVIQQTLRAQFGVECHVVETDSLVHDGGLSWSNVALCGSSSAVLLSREAHWFDVRELDVIWWRRFNYPQRDHPALDDDFSARMATNEWKTALYGILACEFPGRWINDPERNSAAQNKLIQLRAAREAGLSVPRTLVSQDPAAVRRFCAGQADGRVIVKAIRGTLGRTMAAVAISSQDLDDDAVRLCPAIYQELVPGQRHLRLNCFGDDVYAFLIETEVLDWRRNLQACMRPYELDARTKGLLRNVLRILGLEMGIMDAKLTAAGEMVWLEVNPQGQFLFAEGMTGFDLTTPFAKFLIDRST